ncbi:hypothetical protein RHS04_00038 [Rhizoctonia solani]|uniref:Uncharacterized protein n=1 Tax=Rhizoctonia solani TaxID=456999 RepID=A0A8H7LS85_9AGAM|nr:hypothetical protein RHS04_00038 [Rhizoctonia solani]
MLHTCTTYVERNASLPLVLFTAPVNPHVLVAQPISFSYSISLDVCYAINAHYSALLTAGSHGPISDHTLPSHLPPSTHHLPERPHDLPTPWPGTSTPSSDRSPAPHLSPTALASVLVRLDLVSGPSHPAPALALTPDPGLVRDSAAPFAHLCRPSPAPPLPCTAQGSLSSSAPREAAVRPFSPCLVGTSRSPVERSLRSRSRS